MADHIKMEVSTEGLKNCIKIDDEW